MPTRRSRLRRATLSALALASALVLATLTTLVITSLPAEAATITVASAISDQSGSTATVRGYIVGQPTATDTVVTSGYPDDYALAIADSSSETSTSRMLYVQIPSSFRSAWGLQTNPGLKGRQIDVTGTLTAYFSHPGLKSPTAFTFAGSSSPSPTPTPTPTSTPTTPPSGGDIPAGYYDAASGKTGSALKTALHGIIDNNTKLSYDALWSALAVTDRDPANSSNVIEFYSGRSIAASDHGSGVDQWNREHTWAKSHGDFGTTAGPGTDLFHLRPEDVSVNSTRNNLDFDDGGSPVSQCSGCYYDSDSFEPRDAVKGDLARGLFYMAVRYSGDDGFPDLELDNSVDNGTAPYMGKVCTLLAWAAADPVDSAEQQRNDIIYSTYQHNRNPFIDHPEWAQSIFGSSC